MTIKCAQLVGLLALLMGVAGVIDPTLREEFKGPYCALRNTCCADRHDGCSRPIKDTICYCDEFCDRVDASDCCPDYRSYCFGEPDPIVACKHHDTYFTKYNSTFDNCNECRCLDGGKVQCDTELCLTDHDLIDGVNSIHNIGWSARKYDQWWGRKYSEGLRLRLGTKEPSFRVKSMSRLRNTAEGLPRTFSAVDKWSSYISQVPDQGWCGASWVLSTTSVASDRFAIQSKGKEAVHLSAQHILSCTRRQQGCEGGHLDAAWRYMHKKGVVDESCYPYTQHRDACKIHQHSRSLKANGCRPVENVDRDAFYTVGPAYSLSRESDIMAEIFQSGPVQATMTVYRDFFAYSGGIYRRTAANRGAPTGFHSVKLVGWGEEHNEKFWIAANSWGTWWGEHGYFRILRGSNECGIEEYVLASWPFVYNYYNVKSA
ncbi:tubulointerstitial nephritis antigen-like [Drosophila rhopaloa]|uniref:Tubulointerstitial nephritis antigen-like n=1 Tax=Drosophila rhopaloa TaxID=1041015 RepID=A0A6P4EN61_DRORH|nr:tubulointerstitial nephritis antigen-like [Drosophila rhopaloa]XP_016978040.1 tubulointerstitial nephritis antigen-like [Drosophila rhopaloa]